MNPFGVSKSSDIQKQDLKLFSGFKKKQAGEEYPLLPLRELVVFPQTMMSVFITYRAGIHALEAALRRDHRLFAVCQKNAETGETWDTGTVVRIAQHLRLPDGTFRVVLQGEYRARVLQIKFGRDLPMAWVEALHAQDSAVAGPAGNSPETAALIRALQRSFAQYAEFSRKISTDLITAVEKTENAERLSNLICNSLAVKAEKKIELIRVADTVPRLQAILEALELENEIFGIQKNISGKVKSRMEKHQREYILHEQLKEINKELGKENTEDEFAEIEHIIEEKRPGEEVLLKARKEITRLRKLQSFSPEAGVLRAYLEWISELPWSEYSSETGADSGDLARAEEILNEDHFGMRKAKERIIEFIAVRCLSGLSGEAVQVSGLDVDTGDPFGIDSPVEPLSIKGPILCFVGPPGTGKTSLGKSVARALGRRFVRVSLGGVRDEAEIRGHRKTYVGALPGKIIQSMRKAGTLNPVFLLDEIDKLSSDFRGDPAAALLEVLDPEQNSAFTDHYLEVPYDLSKVLFITTANSLHTIPYPLLDRMEIIEIPGYGENEKLSIAKEFLVPKELAENGLGRAKVSFKDEALRAIIRHWTMESGVRGLQREIARCVRRIARDAVNKEYGKPEKKPLEVFRKTIRQEDLEKLLGRRKYKTDVVFKETRTGVCYGLAWTETGGAMLPVETISFEGQGELIITGNLGDVMKESARIALSYLRSVRNCYRFVEKPLPKARKAQAQGSREALAVKERSAAGSGDKDREAGAGIDPGNFDFHIHVPEGAIPKDGPSAGITLAASLLSTLCQIPPKSGIAMTGELTLTGRVLPIGGLKEKLLAAIRNGIEKVLLPEDNQDEWLELDKDIREALEVDFVDNAGQAFLLLFGEDILKKGKTAKARKQG